MLVLLLLRRAKAEAAVHLADEQEDGVGHNADAREGQVEPVGFERGYLEFGDGHVALRNNPHPSGAAVAVERLLDVVADVLVLHVRVDVLEEQLVAPIT